jgi:hypothetical protein
MLTEQGGKSRVKDFPAIFSAARMGALRVAVD